MKAKVYQPKKKPFTMRIREDLLEVLRQESERTGMTMTELVEETIQASLSSVAVAITEERAAAARKFARLRTRPAKA